MTRELRAFLVSRQQSALRRERLPCYGLQAFLCNWLDGFLCYFCVFRLLFPCLVVYSGISSNVVPMGSLLQGC